jgi:hypothetical protein
MQVISAPPLLAVIVDPPWKPFGRKVSTEVTFSQVSPGAREGVLYALPVYPSYFTLSEVEADGEIFWHVKEVVQPKYDFIKLGIPTVLVPVPTAL